MIDEEKKAYMKKYRRDNLYLHNQYQKWWIRINPEAARAIRKRWNEKNKEKKRAGYLAIKEYPEVRDCEFEGCTNIGHRHHPDYTKPLLILWLCLQPIML